MEPRVEVEVIRVPSKAERRADAIAQSQRDANEIAKARNAKTKANREKYANNSSSSHPRV